MKNIQIFESDCLTLLKTIENNSLDSLCTDPPAGISFMNKEWDHHKGGRDEWIKWMTGVMKECLRVLKPGAHGLVWALPRTSHWTATALENAGFEVRDIINHIFGTGFPKSLDISKAIDKEAGAKREAVGVKPKTRADNPSSGSPNGGRSSGEVFNNPCDKMILTAPATDAAKQWQGFGTALKPACEHWILIRKPISEKTVAKNVLLWSTGALNIDASRIKNDQTGSTKTSIKSEKEKQHYCCCVPNVSEKVSGVEQPDKEHPERNQVQQEMPLTFKDREKQSGMEERLHSSGRLSDNKGERKKCVGTPSLDEPKFGQESQQKRDCAPQKPYSERQSNRKPGACGQCGKPHNETPLQARPQDGQIAQGRFPANLTFDEIAAEMLDEQSGERKSRGEYKNFKETAKGMFQGGKPAEPNKYANETGGASRFFYVAKASKSERGEGNTHPTVKSLKLMQYLIKLITPPNGTVLDPFMGSGSTGVAAKQNGFNFMGIEKEKEYFEIANARINGS